MRKKMWVVGICVLMTLSFLTIIPTNIKADAKLRMNQDDIAILDVSGNELSEITWGATVYVKVVIRNIGNKNSDYTDISLAICSKEKILSDESGEKKAQDLYGLKIFHL